MEILKLLWRFLKFPFTVKFIRDQQFNKALRSFFVLGLYQNFSRLQSLASILVITSVFGPFFVGSIMKFYVCWQSNDIPKSVITALMLIRHTVVFGEVLSFHVNKSKIRKMIRNLHELEGSKESDSKNLCDWVIRHFRRNVTIWVLVIFLWNTLILRRNYFVVPVVYETRENLDSLSILYGVYILHLLTYVQGLISVDLLPIISVLKLEGLLSSLCQRLMEITSKNQLENEKKLDRCIKFHVEILK
jgi:hypothetical protein